MGKEHSTFINQGQEITQEKRRNSLKCKKARRFSIAKLASKFQH